MEKEKIETWYHYTDFEKFKCILANGTLRFKCSTQSNDILDTRYFVDLLNESNISDLCEAPEDLAALNEFCASYFKSESYHPKIAAYVACFTEIKDSRLLWDAYTMNRPKNENAEEKCAPKYNGVIIGFNAEKIRALIQQYDDKPEFAKAYVTPIIYGQTGQLQLLGVSFWDFDNLLEEIRRDSDQTQILTTSITGGNASINTKKYLIEAKSYLIERIETLAPAMKHEFWQEEKEVRAILCRDSSSGNQDEVEKGEGNNRYIDLPITEDMIETIVLGPEFGEAEEKELNAMTNAKIQFANLNHEKSKGTGVIRFQ